MIYEISSNPRNYVVEFLENASLRELNGMLNIG